jgi:hypothetical protein
MPLNKKIQRPQHFDQCLQVATCLQLLKVKQNKTETSITFVRSQFIEGKYESFIGAIFRKKMRTNKTQNI